MGESERAAEQAVNYFFSVANLGINTTNSLANTAIAALQPIAKKDPFTEQLVKEIKGGNIDCIFCKDDDELNAVYEELKSQGRFAYKGYFKGSPCILTNKVEREQCKETIEAYEAKRYPETTTAVQLDSYSNGETKTIDVNDYTQAVDFRNRCVANGIPVLVKEGRDGKYSVEVANKDLEKVNAVRSVVAHDMADKDYRQVLEKQIGFENSNQCRIMNETLNGDNIGKVIVSENGTTITANKYELVVDDGVDRYPISRNNPKFYQRAMTVLAESKLVDLTEQEFEEYKNTENKKDYVLQVERKVGRPVLSEQEMEIISRHIKQQEMISKKLSETHPDEAVVNANELNDAQPVYCFTDEELRNYEEAHARSEAYQPDAHFDDPASTLYDEVNEQYDDMQPHEAELTIEDEAAIEEAEEMIFGEEDMLDEEFDNVEEIELDQDIELEGE